MSVSQIRESFSNKGCQIALLVIVGGLIVALAVPPSCGAVQSRREVPDTEVALQVGGTAITYQAIERQIGEISNQGFALDANDPNFLYQVHAQAVNGLVNSAIVTELAAQEGVQIDDSRVLVQAEQEFDNQLMMVRQQLIQQGVLAPDATDQDFSLEVQSQFGQSVDEIRELSLQSVREQLADPGQAALLRAQFAPDLLLQRFEDRVAGDSASVRRANETLVIDLITMPEGSESQADAAVAALEAGQSPAAAVEAAGTGSVSDEPVETTRLQMLADRELENFSEVADGDVFRVATFVGGYDVYRVREVRPIEDAEFTTNQALLLAEYRSAEANRLLNDAFERMRDSTPLEWTSLGYEVVYNMSLWEQDESLGLSESDRIARYREFFDQARAAGFEDARGQTAARLAAFHAHSGFYRLLEPSQQESEWQIRAEILDELLIDTIHPPTYQELAELHMKLGNPELAATTLRQAFRFNVNFDSFLTEFYHSQLMETVEQMENLGQLTGENLALVREAISEWEREFDEFEEFRREMEELDRLNEEFDFGNLDDLVGDPAEPPAEPATP